MEYDNKQRSRSRSPAFRRQDVPSSEEKSFAELPRRSRYNNSSSYQDSGETQSYRADNSENPSRYGGSYGRAYGRGRRSAYNDEERSSSDRSRFGSRPFRGRGLSRKSEVPTSDNTSRNYANSVFVGNLAYDCQSQDLTELFTEAGEVIRSDIITSRGRHKGMGTVEFSNTEGVSKAIQKFDGFTFMGRELFVREDKPPPGSMRSEESGAKKLTLERFHPGYEIFIANLPYSTSWQSLKDLFKACGNPTRADVKLDRNGRSKGFGTVIFETIDEARTALDKFQHFELEGRILELKRGYGPWEEEPSPVSADVSTTIAPQTENASGEGHKSNTIYVDNLPYATAQSDLYDLFETIGVVERAELKYDSKGEPTGAAIVSYEQAEDAETCISRLDKYSYGGRELSISYIRYL